MIQSRTQRLQGRTQRHSRVHKEHKGKTYTKQALKQQRTQGPPARTQRQSGTTQRKQQITQRNMKEARQQRQQGRAKGSTQREHKDITQWQIIKGETASGNINTTPLRASTLGRLCFVGRHQLGTVFGLSALCGLGVTVYTFPVRVAGQARQAKHGRTGLTLAR